jgi:hypothetical protein
MKGPRPFRRNHPKRITWAERAEAEHRVRERRDKAVMLVRSLVADALDSALSFGRLALRRLFG